MRKKHIISVLLLIFIMTVQAVSPVFAVSNTPFKDMEIPGDIWICDFDNGGKGVAYKDGGAPNGDSDYRQGENLNLYDFEFGIGVAMIESMWAKYTVNVKNSGYYSPILYYATPDNNTEAEIIFDDESLCSALLNPTPDYNQCFSQELDNVYLKKGKHVMTFKVPSGGVTLYKLSFLKAESSADKKDFSKKSGSYRTHILPAKIEAEDYDLGAEGSKSVDGKNNGKKYRKNDPIDIFKNSDSGYYIALKPEEFTKYSFEVRFPGSYKLSAKAAGHGKINFNFDDSNAYFDIDFKSSEFQNADGEVFYFEKGCHFVKIFSDVDFSVDSIKFTKTSEDGLDPKEEKEDKNTQEEAVHSIFRNLYVSPAGNDAADGSEASPFQTIKRAKEEVSKINNDMTGDIVVNIAPGYYKIPETEIFETKHSGKNGFNVIFRGTNIFDAPVLSGGTEVKNWEKYNDYLWKAPLEDVSEVRNLYINGYASQRARSKYIYTPLEIYHAEESVNAEDGFSLPNVNVPEKFEHSEDIELVWDLDWTCQRTPVRNVVKKDDQMIFLMDQPYYDWARSREYELTKPGVGGKFYIENAIELLDEPGEFYFDKHEKMIYYYPFKNENLNECEAYVGTTEIMFSVLGENVENRVSNIVFDNLDIRYGAWNKLSETGMVVAQADKILDGPNGEIGRGGTIPPSQLNMKYADNIVIENCEFSCLGSGAIAMPTAVSNVKIKGNSIHDISGSGIIVGNWDHNIPREGMAQCSDIDIMDNVIMRTCREFMGSCGISVYYERNINIIHNYLKELPYTGITLGWGWGEDADFGNIKVKYNYIEDAIIPPIFDGGHIYTLGPLKNSELSYNYLKDTDSKYGAVYPDSGSSFLKVHHNVITGCDHWFFGGLNSTKNIETYDNYSDTDVFYNYGDNDIEAVNLLEEGKWPPEAVEIAQNAGLEDEYKRLLTGLEYPQWRTNFVKTVPKEVFQGEKDTSWTEAEDFNEGGEGIGYHKLKKGDNKTYREGDVIIYQLKDKSYVIGTTFSNEWLMYDVNIPHDGEYALKIKAANAHYLTKDPEPYFNVYIDGVMVLDKVPVKRTATWQIHLPSTLGKVFLKEGKHQVKFEFENNGVSFDSFKFTDVNEEDKAFNSPYYDEGKIIKEEDRIVFTDIENHWAKKTILEMNKRSIVKGVGNKLFCPDGFITREESAILVTRVAGINENHTYDEACKLGFLDDNKSKYEYITREEFVSAVMKAYEKKHGSFSVDYKEGIFSDENEISPVYKVYVLGAEKNKIVLGRDDGRFCPKDNLTRAEATVVISRMY